MIIGGCGLNDGESMTIGGCVFDGVGVLSRSIPEAGANSRTVGVVDCEGPVGLRETGVGGRLSVENGISSEGNFGDDLSTTANGVSRMGDDEDEEVC